MTGNPGDPFKCQHPAGGDVTLPGIEGLMISQTKSGGQFDHPTRLARCFGHNIQHNP